MGWVDRRLAYAQPAVCISTEVKPMAVNLSHFTP